MAAKKKSDDKPKAKMGAPTKLTPALQEELLQLLAAGNYLVTACDSVGIDRETARHWMERGEADVDGTDEGGIYRDFFGAATRALADAEVGMVSALRRGAQPHAAPGEGMIDGDWRAASEYLQRRHPDRWGKQVKETTLKGDPKAPLLLRFGHLNEDDLRAIRDGNDDTGRCASAGSSAAGDAGVLQGSPPTGDASD